MFCLVTVLCAVCVFVSVMLVAFAYYMVGVYGNVLLGWLYLLFSCAVGLLVFVGLLVLVYWCLCKAYSSIYNSRVSWYLVFCIYY